jgi:DNA-binding NarL/FixJ family response regulator
MKPLTEVVAEHVSGVLATVSGAAVVMSVRTYKNPDERRAYQAGASDVLTATALALGLRAEFGPMLLGAPLTLQDGATETMPAAVRAWAATQLTQRKLAPPRPRVGDIARLITAGKSDEEIAKALTLSLDTVMAHRTLIAELLQHREAFKEVEAIAPAAVYMTETEGATRHG